MLLLGLPNSGDTLGRITGVEILFYDFHARSAFLENQHSDLTEILYLHISLQQLGKTLCRNIIFIIAISNLHAFILLSYRILSIVQLYWAKSGKLSMHF